MFFGMKRSFVLSLLFFITILCVFVYSIGQSIVLPFGFSFIFAYVSHSLLAKLKNKFHIPYALSSALLVLLVFSLMILFFIFFVPLALRNIYTIIYHTPNIFEIVKKYFFSHIPIIIQTEIITSYAHMDNILKNMTHTILQSFSNISAVLLQSVSFFVITPIVSYYMAKDWNVINENLLSICPKKYRHSIVLIRSDIRKKLAGYLVGQLYIILFLAVFYGIALFAINMNFGFTIGILTGIASIVPYFGLALGLIVALMMAFLQESSLLYISVVIGIFVIGQIIEGSFLTPKLMSNKIQIHPLWIIFGFLTFGTLFGFFGILFAIPLTATFSVLVKFYVENYYTKHCI